MSTLGPIPDNHNELTPHLRKQGNATQLIVDGKPFLVIGGELHNSSTSSIAYMGPVWERLVALQLNTVLAPVFWELIEPVEGVFDFTLVDGLIQEARRHDLRLILLWFGSWKNGTSSYVPAWVKRDYRRFPRIKRQDGKSAEVLSTLAETNWQADARAFAALMSHIREVDSHDHIVIMIQVENEVGVLGGSRDRSDAANNAFTAAVPQELISQLLQHRHELGADIQRLWEATDFKTSGSWQEIFGSGPETDEFFMAWYYATYVDKVAAAGKAQYNIPMYVNAWLNWENGPDQLPGTWPSGGPLPHTLDVWLAGAPHIDILSPDIYADDFVQWCQRYTRRGNPLFIPETRRGEDGARNVFYAIGQHEAIGTSPFGVDSIEDPSDTPFSKSYTILRQLAPLVLEHQGKSEMAGFVLDDEHPSITRELGGYELKVTLNQGFDYKSEHGYGLVVACGPDLFVGGGYGFQVSFRPKAADSTLVGIVEIDEGEYHNGKWVAGRRLNGDESGSGYLWRFPPLHPQSGNFIFSMSRPFSAIQRCVVYRYE
jgi:hypothetical protein